MKKTLVCVDGSAKSMKAVERAIEIMKQNPVYSEAAVMAVFEPELEGPWITSFAKVGKEFAESGSEAKKLKDLMEKEHKSLGEKWMDDVLEEAAAIFQKEGIEAKRIAQRGHPARKICETAEQEGYDMIVIGSRGLGGLKQYFLGSISNAVIQGANCDVLVVK